MRSLRSDARRGNAATEYVILLMGIAIFVLSIAVQTGATVEAKWRGEDGAGIDEVTGNIDGGGGDDGGGCDFYFNPATGRWHDPDTNLFVSFDEAEGSGC